MLLLDTNVVSELRKTHRSKADPAFGRWAQAVNRSNLVISVITVQELELGILRLERSDPRQAWVLRKWFTDYVLREFKHRILPVTTEVARRCAELLLTDANSYPDCLIAATAYVHGLDVVTRNVQHFVGKGVRIINPWQS